MISWVICGLLLAGYPAFWLLRRRSERQGIQRLTQHIVDLQSELGSWRDQLVTSREQSDGLLEQLKASMVQTGDARAQTLRYQRKIEEVLTERDQAWTLYYDQSVGHGNAQNIMMNLINVMGAKLQKAGVKFEIPQDILSLRQEFQETHEEPSRRALELLEQARLTQTSAAQQTQTSG